MFAPLPLATFASDTSSDVGKNFIKNYIAVVIQIAVIIVIFLIYLAVNKNLSDYFDSNKLIQLVVLIALATGVVKSGTWARKVCGIG